MNDSDKISDGESAAGDGARKREPPTIDLTASEVSDSARAEQQSSDAQASAAPEDAEAPPPKKEDTRPRAASLVWPVIAGAVAAVAVLGAAHLAGWPPAPAPVAQSASDGATRVDVDALGARLAKIEADVAKPAPAPAADPALASRLGALEKSVAALRDDLAAARAQTDKTTAALDALKAAPAAAPVAVAALPDVSAIEERLGRIERDTAALAAKTETPAPVAQSAPDAAAKADVDALGARLAKIESEAAKPAPPTDDPRLRRVAAATLLESAVRDGAPYADALAAAKAAAADPSALAPLDPFAATGLPTAAALCRELLGLLPKSAPKQEAPPSSNMLDRLRQNAMKLVRISRVDAPADDGALARVTAAAKRDDLDAARREAKQLAPAERAPLQAWLDKADARDAARAAARQFAADAMAALSKPVR
jgi:hypothetical protein